MDALVQGIVAHADRALRQLPLSLQAEAAAEIIARVERRSAVGTRGGRLVLGCDGKVKHPTLEEAEDVRVRLQNGSRLHTYECMVCRSFHLGHRR